ncbi:MAG: TIM-barrel domain-containing protein [Candidatus Ornithospirochaeta sp.]
MKWLTNTDCPYAITEEKGRLTVSSSSALTVYGGGERFSGPRLTGKYRNEVEEKFTCQGRVTYLPIPVFFISGLGVFLDTPYVFDIDVEENRVTFSGPDLGEIYLCFAPIKDSLKAFMSMKGEVGLPPSWIFGEWMSANRWKSIQDVREAVEKADGHGFDFSVLVIEAWSDESTFYRFGTENDWSGFPEFLSSLKAKGRHVLLWQCPVYKTLEEGRHDSLHESDLEKVKKEGLEVRNPDGTPYRIPDGHWFSSSMIPDFTNPETANDWMEKRKYLIEMGVSGFKTDGGEFVLSDEAVFSDGRSGREMRNVYPDLYSSLYRSHGALTFSRAGYLGAWKGGVYWAGDQLSTWEELRSVLSAGLSASVSGIFFWGFDIAGFSGPLPARELYLRSYELAAFSPVMQWHSEPVGGQFSLLMKSEDKINDRSPWNIDARCGDVLDICRKFSRIRFSIRWYLEKEARHSASSMEPLMRPMFYSFPGLDVYDQFLLGRSLMVAPILEEGATERKIVIPEGRWHSINTGSVVEGVKEIVLAIPVDEIGLFLNIDSPDYERLITSLETAIHG